MSTSTSWLARAGMFIAGLLLLALLFAGVLLARVWPSAPTGEARLPGLRAPVRVETDAFGVAAVTAGERDDAVAALGYLHARERGFQMELMRRRGAGRLAELFGPAAVQVDMRQRAYQFERAAQRIVAALPGEQRQALLAYAGGVNAALAEAAGKTPEFLALAHTPEAWRAEDSLLVAFGMFQTLNDRESDERMLTVMEAALPRDLVAFLTPDVDRFGVPALAGGAESRRPLMAVPRRAFAALRDELRPRADATGAVGGAVGGVDTSGVSLGSNAWVVAGSRTIDGRALLADDMHLGFTVPNLWYRVRLRYGAVDATGVTIPGLPMIIAGSNRHIAWGYTNVEPDVLDLVRLTVDATDARRYRTPGGWQVFAEHQEVIRVKGQADAAITVQETIYGPVSPAPLLGDKVAIRWTALDPAGADLGLLEMAATTTLEEAIAVANRAGGPPQNVMLADDHGRIAWTLMGRFPKRRGFDGSTAQVWDDGARGWDGFVAPGELPRVIDPPSGYLVTANQRTLGKGYPHIVGHNFADAYRAYRIGQRLAEMRQIDEKAMLALQLDTRSEVFDFYRDLALAHAPTGEGGQAAPDRLLADAARAIRLWDGRMEADSRGIALLVRFRDRLAQEVFRPVAARCRELDPDFVYAWRMLDTPLHALLSERAAETLPPGFADWSQLIRDALRTSARELREQYALQSLSDLPWGRVNHTALAHPFSRRLPQFAQMLTPLLDLPAFDSAGCAGTCVRVATPARGATQRMVISPAHLEEAIFHMPGGQAGNPFSRNYADQHAAWRDGTPLPLLPGNSLHVLTLR